MSGTADRPGASGPEAPGSPRRSRRPHETPGTTRLRPRTPLVLVIVRVERGPEPDRLAVVRPGVEAFSIGSDPLNDLVIVAPGVEPRHVVLTPWFEVYRVESLADPNLTRLNKDSLSQPLVVHDGDRLTLGPEVTLRFRVRLKRRASDGTQLPLPEVGEAAHLSTRRIPSFRVAADLPPAVAADQLRHADRAVRVLYEIADLGHRRVLEPELASIALEVLVRAYEAPAGVLALVDAGGMRAEIVATVPPGVSPAGAMEKLATRQFSREALEAGAAPADDADEFLGYSEALLIAAIRPGRAVLRASSGTSWLYAPIAAGSRIVGSLALRAPPEVPFTPTDLDFVGAVLGLAGNQIRQRQLELEVRHLSELVETADDAIVSVDLTGRVRFMNARAETLFGPRDEVVGGPVRGVPPALVEKLLIAVAQVYETGRAVALEEHVEPGTKGRGGVGAVMPRELSIRLSPVFARTGAVAAISAIIRDLTPRRQLERQAIQQEKMASIGLLAAGVAHEFNNILTGMSGYAQLAQLSPDDKQVRDQALAVVLDNTARARGIIEALLSFSGWAPHSRQPVEIGALMRDVLTLVEKELLANAIRVAADLPATTPTLVNPGQIQQVFLNLLLNARDAIGFEGQVWVSVRETPVAIETRVRDTGAGIAPDLLDHIFEPFFTTKGAFGGSATPGTGLGLALSYSIVTDHDGVLTVSSAPGHGATFTVTLPRRTEEPATAPVRESAGLQARLPQPGVYQILVAERDPQIREMVAAALTRELHTVSAVPNAKLALKWLQTRAYDCCIADLAVLREPDGEALARAMLETDPPGRLIVLTDGRPPERLRGLLEQAHARIEKPFQLADLLHQLT